jgi:hypothetical protein
MYLLVHDDEEFVKLGQADDFDRVDIMPVFSACDGGYIKWMMRWMCWLREADAPNDGDGRVLS